MKSATEPYIEDPEFPGRTPSEVRRLREDAAQARRERDRHEEAIRKDDKDSREYILAMLAAEQHRRAVAELFADISDTRKAVVHAHERAIVAETAAAESLKSAQRNAVVLADGRRVYFTADGSKLYNEDDREIVDAGVIAEARERHFLSTTTHEEIIERRQAMERAAENSRRLQNALVQMDEIEAKLASEKLSPEELNGLKRDMNRLIADLPADARDEYDQLCTARHDQRLPSYRPADPAFESAPLLNSDFRKAVSAAVQVKTDDTPDPIPQKPPVYRAVPEF